MSRNCCIPGCSIVNSNTTASLCRVPAKRFCSGEKYKWAEDLEKVILGIRGDPFIKNLYKRDTVRICHRHFVGEDIQKKGTRIELKIGALPRLNMPIKSVPVTKSTGRPPPRKRKLKSPTYHQKLDDVKKSAVRYLPEGWLLHIEEDNVWFSLKPASFGELSPITICINKSFGIWAAYYGWATTSCKFLQDIDLETSTLSCTLNKFANAGICDGISLEDTEALDDLMSIHHKCVMAHPISGPPLQQRIAVRSNKCDIFLTSGKMCDNCRQRERQLQKNKLRKVAYHDKVGQLPLARANSTTLNSRKMATIRFQEEKLKELERQVEGLLRDRFEIGSEVAGDLKSVMANGVKLQPFEIWENRTKTDNSKTGSGESTNKKAKFLAMDESAISWNYGQQNSTAVAALPITSVPQVVVNLVQGNGTYRPVAINRQAGSGTPQQWAQVQVGKGQLVTTGVIPITQQVKQETSQTPTPSVQLPNSDVSSQNSVESAPGAEVNSHKLYTTLSLVSEDSRVSESKNNSDATSAEIATSVPATPALSESNQIIQASLLPTETTAPLPAVIPAPEFKLDSIQFTKINTDDQQQRAPTTRVTKSEDGTGNTHEHSNIRKSRSLADSELVTITPEHMEYLYQKYPEIKQEPPISGTCDVMQLFQHGKARQRKSSEQNAFNNSIRTILDTAGIVESGDTRVQDAVCLIMDRYTVLQEHMNDAYVRKQLTSKVKHSIYCKNWRLKRHKIKQLEMSSSSSPDAQAWMFDPNTSKISISSNNSPLNEDTFLEIRIGAGSKNSLFSQENLSEMRKVMSPNNSLLNDESLHS